MALRSSAEAFRAAAKFLSIMNSAMIVSRRLDSGRIRLCALKSVPNGISRRLGTIGALRLVQNVSDMRGNSIEADRQHERNILVRASDGKQAQNLDFANRKTVGKGDAMIPRMQQGIDIDYQARHSESTRQLLRLAQPLKAQAALRVRLPRHQESAGQEQRPCKGRPRAH